jgi:Lysylphosphatidylglycerol synthase TM region
LLSSEWMTNTAAANKKRFTPFGIIFTIGGIALFAYFVRQAGVNQIIDGIRRLGAGFLLIIAISGVRHTVRSIAWILCMEAPHRLRFWDALRARLMGDAIGNVVPLGSFVISEPAKPALIRDRVPLMAGFSSLVIENVFYSLSVITFVFAGMVALLLNFTLPKGLRLASLITIVVIAIIISAGIVFVRGQIRFISHATAFLHRRGLNQKWIDKSRVLEDRVYGFYQRNGARFLPILFLEGCFHLAGVIEIYVTLYFISPQQPPTLFTAFILESVNRVITMGFKFVPLRMGVDEAGTGKVSKILQFTEAAGVTLAIVRKARDLFWACVGAALLIHRAWSLRGATRDAEAVVEEESAAANIPRMQPKQT